MNDIAHQRLCAQHLAEPAASAPELVARMLAMQAQEYIDALWAVGQRVRGGTEAAVERALAAGEILRTHPMRGTHHFVAREDLRWLMALMGPVNIRRNARRERELGLTEKTLARAVALLDRELTGGNHLARAEVAALLERSGISPEGQRLPHIVYRAELESVVCSGVRKGKQVTFARFDERVPPSRPRAREVALADLARRYFATRGPATRKDFLWWSQLSAADADAGMERIAGELETIVADGRELLRAGAPAGGEPPRALLLPPYDEYTVAYADRSAVGAVPAHVTGFPATSRLGFNLVLDGQVVGSWTRRLEGGTAAIVLAPFRRIAAEDRALLVEEARRYARFRGLEAEVLVRPVLAARGAARSSASERRRGE